MFVGGKKNKPYNGRSPAACSHHTVLPELVVATFTLADISNVYVSQQTLVTLIVANVGSVSNIS